jgi:Family of unknown function (DUF6173)
MTNYHPGVGRSRSTIQVSPNAEQITEAFRDVQNDSSAERLANHILKRMELFDEELDKEHEVGIKLVSFGQTHTFHVSEIGVCQPSLIIFRGYTDNEEPVELIQHVSQISFLLMCLPRLEPEAEKKKITMGFIQSEE